MAALRKPLQAAKASGAILKNPKRFDGRAEPEVAKLGKPPAWMVPGQKAVWNQFREELPWLGESDRALLEIACLLRARIAAGEEVGIQALNLLRQTLGQMGATPADRSKVKGDGNDGKPDDEDPIEKYIN